MRLDDPDAHPCGVCANCQGRGFAAGAKTALIAEAVSFLKHEELVIEPRKMWPAGLFPDRKPTIPAEQRLDAGRALCYYGDAGWGKHVQKAKYSGKLFDDELLKAAVDKIREQWKPGPFPAWVTAIPSLRLPNPVTDFAGTAGQCSRLAVFTRARSAPNSGRNKRLGTIPRCKPVMQRRNSASGPISSRRGPRCSSMISLIRAGR